MSNNLIICKCDLEEEYRGINDKYNEVLEELKLLIPDSNINILEDFIEVNSDLIEYESKQCYSQGFKDGATTIIKLKA